MSSTHYTQHVSPPHCCMFADSGFVYMTLLFVTVAVRSTAGGRQLPVMTVVAGFSRPAAGSSVLLTHSKAETLFHEIGHVTHHLSDLQPISQSHSHCDGQQRYMPGQLLNRPLSICSFCLCAVSVATAISICPALAASWTSWSCPAYCSRTSYGTTEFSATSRSIIGRAMSYRRRWWTTSPGADDSSSPLTRVHKPSWYHSLSNQSRDAHVLHDELASQKLFC